MTRASNPGRVFTLALVSPGYTTSAVVRHGVTGRDARFVQKPFAATTLLVAVRRALEPPHDERAAGSTPASQPTARQRKIAGAGAVWM